MAARHRFLPVNEIHIDRIPVTVGARSYTVAIGPGVRHELPDVLGALDARRVVVVSSRPTEWTPDPGIPARVIQLSDGEHTKTLTTVESLCRSFAEFGLGRRDAVVACGGGTITDTTGLAASLYHRGIPVVHLPTSLLAQVDASVGGKTAVNLPGGKNLIGSYWQPSAVLCDTDYLSTLPVREQLNGLGELARCHFIGVPGIGSLPLGQQIVASVRLKASIVGVDERDSGLRHILNYGHTLGHAVERATDFRIRHGEAVAIGTYFAGALAQAVGRIDLARKQEHLDVLRSYGLNPALPADLATDDLLPLLRADKKATHGLSFVLDGPNGVELVSDVDPGLVHDALAEMPREER
ncbi:3-dehydroquinate synthase family protein [Actinoplanes sp. NPDC020271]|uniref:3-dehydroquinate synthase family protein n=1 Tax=Actinoplanes sp. NPDC020271 TaxID=3363896 RepID=UPI0037969659